MPPRLYLDEPLQAERTVTLPPGPSRHVQVLRLQPGAAVTLFDGRGGEWSGQVLRIGRSEVQVRLGAHVDVERELPWPVTLALGVPANERMDAVIEKATELGALGIQPLLCERSVLRLQGERADKKVRHWQAVAVAASEQSGRTRVPRVAPVLGLHEWLQARPAAGAGGRWLLSVRPDARPLPGQPPASALECLSGPEGGWSDAEEAAARGCGFCGVTLGPRVLRADTAPLAVLAHVALAWGARDA
jgi:16S rRNA (uracil1498-N3)-methyltransferase